MIEIGAQPLQSSLGIGDDLAESFDRWRRRREPLQPQAQRSRCDAPSRGKRFLREATLPPLTGDGFSVAGAECPAGVRLQGPPREGADGPWGGVGGFGGVCGWGPVGGEGGLGGTGGAMGLIGKDVAGFGIG